MGVGSQQKASKPSDFAHFMSYEYNYAMVWVEICSDEKKGGSFKLQRTEIGREGFACNTHDIPALPIASPHKACRTVVQYSLTHPRDILAYNSHLPQSTRPTTLLSGVRYSNTSLLFHAGEHDYTF